MKRYADEVIICYDSDEAGQKATARAIGFLRNAGLNIKIISIPQGKDPDEFLRNKGDSAHDAFKNVIEGSGNDVEYRLTKLRQSFNLEISEGKVAYLTEAAKLLATLDNAIEQDVYISKLCKELEVSPDAVKQQIKKYGRKRYYEKRNENFRNMRQDLSGRNDKVNTERYKKPRVATAEEGIIAYLLKNPDRLAMIENELSAEKFQTEFNRKLFEYFSRRIKNGQDALSSVSGDFTQEETAKIYQIANSDYARMSNDNTARENIKVINDEYFKQRVSDPANADMDSIAEQLRRMKESRK